MIIQKVKKRKKFLNNSLNKFSRELLSRLEAST